MSEGSAAMGVDGSVYAALLRSDGASAWRSRCVGCRAAGVA